MRRMLALSMAVLVSGCLASPVTAPTPLAFHSSRTAKEATQVAAIAMINAGFRVTQSDSVGEALVATRTATNNGNQDYVICAFPRGSGAAANRETSLTISFKAKPSSDGSDVNVEGKVRTSYPGYEGTSMQVAPNETDCVSSGAMERQLESALR